MGVNLWPHNTAWEMGIRSLHVEVDSQQVYKWINSIEDCKNLLNGNWTTNIDVVFREANRVAADMEKLK